MKSTSEPKEATAYMPAGSGNTPLLEIRNVHAQVGGQSVLQGLDLSITQGDFLALLGHNGAGKSTLMRTIMGLVKPRQGTIVFDGRSLQGMATPQIKKQGLGLVPQQRGYFENLSVLDNLSLVEGATGGSFTLETIFEMFPILVERQKQLVGTMSGGQRQMVAISIALLSNPKLLMLDEPSVGLQPNLVERVMEVAKDINEKFGITIILVEQNIEKALGVAGRVAVVNRGRIALDKPTAAVEAKEIWDLL